MKKLRILLPIALLLIAFGVVGTYLCTKPSGTKIPPSNVTHECKNGIYYWSTEFKHQRHFV